MAGVITSPGRHGTQPVADGDELTEVELTWRAKRRESWLRFGTPSCERRLDPERRILSFCPGAIFALVRWAANQHGTTQSRIDIVRTTAHRLPFQTLPCIRPGGEILLTMAGWPQVARVLEAADAIEALDIALETVSPDHWRHVHNRITAGQQPRRYTVALHRAFLLRGGAMS